MNLKEILKNSELGKDNSEFYNNNKPYPYICIDNFFNNYQPLLNSVKELQSDINCWNMQRNSMVRVNTLSPKCVLPKDLLSTFKNFNSKNFINFLANLTKYQDLKLDRTFTAPLTTIPRLGKISPQTSPQQLNMLYRKVTVLIGLSDINSADLVFYNENPFMARNFIKLFPNKAIIFNSEDMIYSLENNSQSDFCFAEFNFYNKELPKRELIMNTRFF